MSFLLPISSAFAHTRCISPSVCLLKSFMQASTFAPSPFSARASAIRSRTCGRQRLAFLAASATGGARKPNPSEGAEAAPPHTTDLARCKKRHGRISGNAIVGQGIQPLSRTKGATAPLAQGSREARTRCFWERLYGCTAAAVSVLGSPVQFCARRGSALASL